MLLLTHGTVSARLTLLVTQRDGLFIPNGHDKFDWPLTSELCLGSVINSCTVVWFLATLPCVHDLRESVWCSIPPLCSMELKWGEYVTVARPYRLKEVLATEPCRKAAFTDRYS